MSYPKTSTDAGKELGITRDGILYILRIAPELEPKQRFGGRRMFMQEDIEKIRGWMKSRKTRSTKHIQAAV